MQGVLCGVYPTERTLYRVMYMDSD
jgi:hypothetical protein